MGKKTDKKTIVVIEPEKVEKELEEEIKKDEVYVSADPEDFMPGAFGVPYDDMDEEAKKYHDQLVKSMTEKFIDPVLALLKKGIDPTVLERIKDYKYRVFEMSRPANCMKCGRRHNNILFRIYQPYKKDYRVCQRCTLAMFLQGEDEPKK